MSNRLHRALLPLAAAGVVLLSVACGSSASNSGTAGGNRNPDELVFAAIPTENSVDLQQSFQPVIEMLKKETGKQITFQKATDYAAIIEAQRTGKIDIAMYGPFSYVLARNSGLDIIPVGALIREKGAESGYRSYGVVKTGSPIRDLADAKGKKVCFVDPNSTSGYLYPTAELIDADLDPAKDITPIMAGGHDASVLAVASGQCDLGFAYDVMVDTQLLAKGQIKPGEITTVWKSDLIPGSPIAVSNDLAADLKDTLVTALREKGNAEYLKANGFCGEGCSVGDGGYWGFTPIDDSLYDGVRQVCKVTKDKQCTRT